MKKQDILLYIIGLSIFGFVSFILVKTQYSLQRDLSSGIQLENKIPQLEQTKIRYEYLSKILLANTIRKNIAFLIGVMMIILGTILIISRIKSDIRAQVDLVKTDKFHITTTSPGVFIVLLGTIIVVTTVLKSDVYKVEDSPLKTTSNREEPMNNTNQNADDTTSIDSSINYNE